MKRIHLLLGVQTLVAFLAAFSIVLLWRRGAQPLFVYHSVAYGLGLAATFVYKLL